MDHFKDTGMSENAWAAHVLKLNHSLIAATYWFLFFLHWVIYNLFGEQEYDHTLVPWFRSWEASKSELFN